ncbi:aminopeptidase P family protein [uncultured Tessaracoccus sp.]|uniref:aminopeptidase P family protein n=1 Tax=uncultured Tessaracoccus sp. TaxID=905023 RepID=UPI0025F88BC4|nr:aminopeptidase P family protein [uncultured Tessaracoccus sp.]
MSDSNANRRDPFSEEFKKFIVSGWAPYSSELPATLPSAEWAARRRAALVEQYPDATMVLPAGPLKVRANDTDYRFRPHTAFAYFTGLGEDREPDAALVVSKEESVLFFRPRAPRTDREFYADARYGEMWVGQRDSLEEMASAVQMECRDIRTLEEYLTGRERLRVLREADPELTSLVDRVRGGADESDDAELHRVAATMRFAKDEYEISEMGRAIAATKVGFDAVVRELPNAVANGRGERWVEGIFGLHARHLGNAVGYDTIAAGGDHANTLHWIVNDGELRDGDLLLLDAGVEVNSLYTADITRTLPVSGTFTEPQRHVYDAVLRAQAAGIDACRAGEPWAGVHAAAIRVVAEFCKDLGILPGTVDESLSERGGYHRRWMVHGTSHHLGLDVHDCAHASREDYREGDLREGMIITVEPGIYFKSTDLLVPEEYRGIGVRIEDDILITDGHPVVMSDALPRTADEVEAWVRAARQ